MNNGRVSLLSPESAVSLLDADPRWQLVQRIVTSQRFQRAPLLSRFLMYVCAEMLNGRQQEISEYRIGILVFDRPRDYRTAEDNIVRNYARQLRKRLAEYFAGDGAGETLRLEIPLGGYVPVFVAHVEMPSASEAASATQSNPALRLETLSKLRSQCPQLVESAAYRLPGMRNWTGVAFGLIYGAALVVATVVVMQHRQLTRHSAVPAHALWAAMFGGPGSTIVVPADCGFNVLEDLTKKQMDLPGYLHNDYQTLPLPGIDAHSQADLRTQEFTSFVDLEVITSLLQLPETEPHGVEVRFPRDLRMDDLKSGNEILIGSLGSNPWAGIAQRNLNFRIEYGNEMREAWVVNSRPRPGEANRYVSAWNEPAHLTYAVVAYEPNLVGNGHLLLIQGLDVAGTQAAAEALLKGRTLVPVLQAARLPDGRLRPFEVLLQSTSIASNAAITRALAYRIE